MIPKYNVRWHGPAGALTLMLALAAAASGQVTINPPSLSGEATVPFSQTFTASGGTGPYTWASSGSLDGLALNPATGVLSGTPGAAGSFPFTVTATDSTMASATSPTLTLTVIAGPGINPGSLPTGEQGVPYGPTLSGTGGPPGYTWLQTGVLPSNVSFN